MQRCIGPTMEICGNSGPPIAMVPCLHQINVYIKRKLRVWRAHKCNFFVGAKTVRTGTGLQTTSCHAAPYWANNIYICGNSGPPIAMVPCLHQINVFIKRKLRVCRAQKCNILVGAKTVLTGTGLQTTLCHAAPYRVNNGNLRKFGSTYRHGTVFPPNQCSYQKEAAGV